MFVNPLASDLNHILDHTRELWDELRGTRIFITGGTGFFGCWMVESFLWANDRLNLDAHITILTRSPSSFRIKAPHLAAHESVAIMSGDVRTFDFPKGEFSHIIHAATEASAKLNAEDPLLMLDTIIEGTRYTLDFAKACNAKKLLLTSSGAVYGKQPSELMHISEDFPGAPDPMDIRSAYGLGKRMAEHLCAVYAKDSMLELKIARCFAFVGPFLPLNAHFAIGNFIRDALNGGPIVIKGDGTPRRSYLYASDLAIWLWKILFHGTHLCPYNVGSNEAFSITEVAQQVAEQFHPIIAIETRGNPNPWQGPEHYVPDSSRAKNELGLKLRVRLTESIQRTIRFHQGAKTW